MNNQRGGEGASPKHAPDTQALASPALMVSTQELELAGFSPGYFALVMATGMVSITCQFQGREAIALGLFGLNIAAWLVLWGMTLVRLVWFRKLFINDLTHHSRGAAFLTNAAATCVLGSQFALLTSWMGVAEALWFLGAGLSVLLSYTLLVAIAFCTPKPPLEASIDAVWLLVAAVESVSVLGALLAPSMGATDMILLISLTTYLIGAVLLLYVSFAALILYRWMLFSRAPERPLPHLWTGMGALAITTLAGALLIQTGSHWALVQALAPIPVGLTICFWVMATWWIPLLLAVELWRHLRGRVPFNYGPDNWALVFPLGMYAAATFMLVKVSSLTFLNGVAAFFAHVALIAWLIVFGGMLHYLALFALHVAERPPRNRLQVVSASQSERQSGELER